MDSGKKSFVWLVVIFVAPILLGTLLFFNLDRLGFKKGSVNYGALIQPAFPLAIRDLLDQSGGKAKREETIAKKWTMLYVEMGECDQFCKDRLLLMKRVRLLTNEQMRRVRTTLVSNQSTNQSVDKKLNHELVMAIVRLKSSAFLAQFPDLDKKPIYLIDPLGNLMMKYTDKDPNAKKMIKDLLKLLKYSHLG